MITKFAASVDAPMEPDDISSLHPFPLASAPSSSSHKRTWNELLTGQQQTPSHVLNVTTSSEMELLGESLDDENRHRHLGSY